MTPCRDEAVHLPENLPTVTGQTIPPTRWIIVDDGSTDDTPRILAEAARQHSFIEVVRREDRGERKVGPGVIEAFYSGLERLNLDDYDYVCKLDADLEVPPGYFERLIQEMEADPQLGTVSGKVYLRDPDGRLSHERRGDETSVGPSKFYRVRCFRDIGGFERAAGWDGIDGHMCRTKGWIARSIDEPGLRLVHRRQKGSSQRHVFAGRVREGTGRRYVGTSPLYFALSVVYRIAERPYLVGALCMAWGYLRAALSGAAVFGDEPYHRTQRRFEREALLFGKRRALERANLRARARLEAVRAGSVEKQGSGA